MITYAAVKPISEYNILLEGQTLGIYTTYSNRPHVLALMLLMSPIGYFYEVDGTPPAVVPVLLKRDDVLEDTLEEDVGGKPVKDILSTMNPVEICDFLREEDLSHLTVTQAIFGGNTGSLRFTMEARAGAWLANRRGKIKSESNLIQAQFRRKETSDPYERELLVKYDMAVSKHKEALSHA